MDEPIQPLRVAMEIPRAADSIVLTESENAGQQAGEVSAVPSEPHPVSDVSQNSTAYPNAVLAAEPVAEIAPENPLLDSAVQAEPIEAVDLPPDDPVPAPSLKSRH